MAKKKPQKTTRDTSFNFDKDVNSHTIYTLSNYTATKEFPNITLMGAEDGMSVKGAKIKQHANDNRTMKDLGYNITVNTDNITDNKTYNIYGAPFKSVLNNRQHYNNCGVESTLNTLAMAGIIKMKDDLSDQKSVEKKFLKSVWDIGLVGDSGVIGKLDEADGGTEPDDYKDILRQYDIDSEAYFISRKCDGTQFNDVNELAYKISQGYGAVLGVCSSKLWQEQKSETDEIAIDHAVAIVGVVYADATKPVTTDEDGNITGYNAPVGFYIHDSGGWMTRYISYTEFLDVTLYYGHGMSSYADYLAGKYVDYDPESGEIPLTEEQFVAIYNPDYYNSELRNFDSEEREYIGKKPNGIFVTITSEPIKSDVFNLNATGDKQDNTIIGNSGDNVIKGMDGKDTLYGNAGDDEIRGGNGNDVIIGNNISEAVKNALNVTFNFGIGSVNLSNNTQAGINKLYGDGGNDIIIGGDDIDLIYGGAGNDKIYAGDGRNAVYAGKGNDLVVGGWENDRLFGDAGNDTIYGGGDDDTINGGDGNDTIYGGSGNDRIETGKGKDTVYFEGTQHGLDEISSQGGSTTLQFIDEVFEGVTYSDGAKISDMYFKLERNEDNDKKFDFGITYTPDEDNAKDGVAFDTFFNSKTNKAKSLTLAIGEGGNAETYKVSATSKKTANLSKSTTNNILFTTYEGSNKGGGTTITTSANNDIVTMVETEDKFNRLSDLESVCDEITYTGGIDRYVSEERNTRYYVSEYSDNTNLTIRDNVEALEKVKIGAQGMPVYDANEQVETEKVVSKHDELYVTTSSESNLHFFFDVKVDDNKAYTTVNDGLYILNNTNFKNVITGDAKGIITMDSFFGYDFDTKTAQEFAGTGFFGNGRIETMYYGEGTDYASYTAISDLTTDLTTIAGQVVGWLSEAHDGIYYSSAFDAISSTTIQEGDLGDLIACYNINSNN